MDNFALGRGHCRLSALHIMWYSRFLALWCQRGAHYFTCFKTIGVRGATIGQICHSRKTRSNIRHHLTPSHHPNHLSILRVMGRPHRLARNQRVNNVQLILQTFGKVPQAHVLGLPFLQAVHLRAWYVGDGCREPKGVTKMEEEF